MNKQLSSDEDKELKPLTYAERSQVAPKLEGIFTLTPAGAEKVMKDNPQGSRALLSACVEMTDDAASQAEPSREWFAHIMVLLTPGQLIQQGSGRGLRVDAPRHASLIHSYPVEGYWASLGRTRELPNRARFIEHLQQELSAEARNRYEPLLGRRHETGEIAVSDITHQARHAVHVFFQTEVRALIPSAYAEPGRPLAPDTVRFLRKRAFDKFYALMVPYLQAAPRAQVAESAKDQLIARALIHVEMNRELLEIGRYGSLSKQALELLEPFLVLLNSAGITEVPDLQDEVQAKALFKAWFGKAGVLMRKAPEGAWSCVSQAAFSRMWRHAGQAASHYYTKGRGRHQVVYAPGFRAQANECFAMLLVLLACDFYKAKVPKEVPGQKATVYPVQSCRDATVKNNDLAPHALELVCMMYGQLIMSNDGWELWPERVRAYWANSQFTRDAEAWMVNFFFKTPPAAEVLVNVEAFLRMFDEKVLPELRALELTLL